MRYMLFTRLLERAINLRGNRAMAAQLKLIDSEDKKGNMDRQKALEAALSQIDRAFGQGPAMKLGSRDKMETEAVSTGSLGLDIALEMGSAAVAERVGPEWKQQVLGGT